MKKINRIKLIIPVLVLMLSAVLICSCGDVPDDPTPPTPVSYTLNVVDFAGAPADIVAVVEFCKGEEVIATKRLSDEGKATFEALPGDYVAEISFPNVEYAYDSTQATFTADKTTATVTVYDVPGSAQTISVPAGDDGHVEYNAKSVSVGATYVTIDRAEMSYFIFTPTKGGIYRFSCKGADGASFGYYGSVHFVQPFNLAEPVDGAFELTVPDSSVSTGAGGTAQYVLGVSSASAKNAVITIERVGNYVPEMGYTDIYPETPLTKVDNLLNNTLVDLDITDPNLNVVFSEADGYYHLGAVDGPIVLIKISVGGNSHVPGLILPSFVTICETDRMSYYVYDDNGTLVRKESYNTLIEAYADACGSKGVIPMDKTIAEAIKNTGDHRGWWEGFIFGDDAALVVKNNAWLFACCYEEENVLGSSDKPITVTPVSEEDKQDLAVLVGNGSTVTVLVSTTKGALTFTAKEGVTVTVDGTEHTPDEDGRITVEVNPNTAFTITYTSAEQDSTTVHFTCVTPTAD